MNFLTFVGVVVSSTVLTIAWHFIFHILPAYKKLKIAEALVALAKCIRAIDEDPLLNGKISKGGYLHDTIYKLIHGTLTNKVDLHFSMLKQIPITKERLSETTQFQDELASLDEDTRRFLDVAMFAVAKILVLRNPIIFIMVSFKIRRGNKHQKNGKIKLRKKMITSAEAIAINAKKGDYSWLPC
jgi:hypothetical protein